MESVGVNTKTKLKPCKFCGRAPEIWNHCDYSNTIVTVACMSGLTGCNAVQIELKGRQPFSGWKQAADDWNRNN